MREYPLCLFIKVFPSGRRLLGGAVSEIAESYTARVAVGREGGRIVISVKDDGIGFDPDTIEESLTGKGGGFGLFNIRRRIIHLGGAFEVESSPGAGTCVTIGMPLERVKDEIS